MQLKFCYQEEKLICPWYIAVPKLARKGLYDLLERESWEAQLSAFFSGKKEYLQCIILICCKNNMCLKTSGDSNSWAPLAFLKVIFKAVFILSLEKREAMIYLAHLYA